MSLRAFVAAMLGPHQRKDAQFGQVWLAADEPDNPFVFLGGEVVFCQKLLVNHVFIFND
jgi:hypothetical protein